MSDLIVIVYPTVTRADEVRRKLLDLQNEHLVSLDDAVIATMMDGGRVKLDQLMNPTASGAASGSFWGLLIGVLLLSPLLGVATGTASGALSGALNHVGLNDAFMKKLAANLEPGKGALFLLVKVMTADKVLAEIKKFGGVVLKTSLDESKEQVLRDALMEAKAAENTDPSPERI